MSTKYASLYLSGEKKNFENRSTCMQAIAREGSKVSANFGQAKFVAKEKCLHRGAQMRIPFWLVEMVKSALPFYCLLESCPKRNCCIAFPKGGWPILYLVVRCVRRFNFQLNCQFDASF